MGRHKEPNAAHSTINVRVTEQLHDDIEMIAKMDGISVSEYLRGLLMPDVEARKASPNWPIDCNALKLRRIAELQAEIATLEGK